MQGYFIQFLAYTMAMVGFLTICLFVYKKLCAKTLSGINTDCLCIENVLRINARKQIYIVKAGNERFLIASDTERTTMLAKLDDEIKDKKEEIKQQPVILKKAAKKHLGNIIQAVSEESNSSSMMKRISEKMKA